MKISLCTMGIATLFALTSLPAKALDDNLVYVAVEPCRLADTRQTSPMLEGQGRNFRVSSANLAGQGGDPTGCLHPRAAAGVAPLAASVYIVAVSKDSTKSGWLTAYPSDEPTPVKASVATLNYGKGQIIGNTTNVTLCPGSCPDGGKQLGLVSYQSDQEVVIDVQGYYYPAAGSCSDDMVAVGSLCVDKYESSVWSTPTGGTQYGTGGVDNYPCANSGRDCGASAANPIYALSTDGVEPSTRITQYQAQQACANVGKRLPTTTEWQMAASGTPSGTATCNFTGAVTNTGAIPACVSTTGAFDMIGNLWEWGAELESDGAGFTDTNDAIARAHGDGWNNDGNASTRALWVLDGTGSNNTGAQRASQQLGLRCVR